MQTTQASYISLQSLLNCLNFVNMPLACRRKLSPNIDATSLGPPRVDFIYVMLIAKRIFEYCPAVDHSDLLLHGVKLTPWGEQDEVHRCLYESSCGLSSPPHPPKLFSLGRSHIMVGVQRKRQTSTIERLVQDNFSPASVLAAMMNFLVKWVISTRIRKEKASPEICIKLQIEAPRSIDLAAG